jgi:hypothetical protein
MGFTIFVGALLLSGAWRQKDSHRAASADIRLFSAELSSDLHPKEIVLRWTTAITALIIFVLLLVSSHRSMYMPANPFSGILAFAVLESARCLRDAFNPD